MASDHERPESTSPEAEDSERTRFVGFAEKLVQVPKEIDEKAEEWKRERKRGGSN